MVLYANLWKPCQSGKAPPSAVIQRLKLQVLGGLSRAPTPCLLFHQAQEWSLKDYFTYPLIRFLNRMTWFGVSRI